MEITNFFDKIYIKTNALLNRESQFINPYSEHASKDVNVFLLFFIIL